MSEIPGVVEFTDATPAAIIADLERRGYTAAALTDGAQVNSLFLAADLVDEIRLTVEPLIFGRGIGVFEDAVFERRARFRVQAGGAPMAREVRGRSDLCAAGQLQAAVVEGTEAVAGRPPPDCEDCKRQIA
ncbi:MAG: dihydrofolate reductase family protein [Chloroflexia bacterium]